KLRVAGLGSVLPAGSVARTSKTWAPEARSLAGVWLLPAPEQGPNGAESKRHWKLEPGSEEEKPKVGVASLVEPEGPESIVVSGGSSSTQSTRTLTVASEPPLSL